MTAFYSHPPQILAQNANTGKPLTYSVWDALAFIIPASTFLEMNNVGRIFGPDIICLTLFPVLVLKHSKVFNNKLIRIFIILGILYLCGQILTDLVRQTDFFDYSRGWAKIIVTIICFCSISMLIGFRRTRIMYFSWGIASGLFIKYFINPMPYAEWEPWKFGVGVPITFVLILTATFFWDNSYLKSYLAFIIVFAAATINLYFGFRSLSGICFLTLGYLLLHNYAWKNIDIVTNNPKKRFILLGIGIITTAILVLQIYSHSARNGWLGEEQAKKYKAQANGIYGLIVGGRSEILVSSRAIMDSPLIGHGSWAKDWEYTDLLIYLKRQFGYVSGPANDIGLIPTHSHLFGAWVEAGILGGLFWGWVVWIAARAGIRLFQTSDRHMPFFSFIIFLLVWDILFSPFGAIRRFLIPFYIIVSIDIITRYSRKSGKYQYENFHRNSIL
jgi:hypothetical protein